MVYEDITKSTYAIAKSGMQLLQIHGLKWRTLKSVSVMI